MASRSSTDSARALVDRDPRPSQSPPGSAGHRLHTPDKRLCRGIGSSAARLGPFRLRCITSTLPVHRKTGTIRSRDQRGRASTRSSSRLALRLRACRSVDHFDRFLGQLAVAFANGADAVAAAIGTALSIRARRCSGSVAEPAPAPTATRRTEAESSLSRATLPRFLVCHRRGLPNLMIQRLPGVGGTKPRSLLGSGAADRPASIV